MLMGLCFCLPQTETHDFCFTNNPHVVTRAKSGLCCLTETLLSLTYVVCVVFVSAVTNKKPTHVSITKVKQFQGSSAFAKRSQWTIDQLRQVNGIDPNKVCY